MKILIVGLGSIGTRHLNNLHTLGVAELLIYRSRKLTPPVEITDKETRIYHDYDEALACKPDAVIIANPTSMHLDFAKKALEAGCHIYLEKPVSNTLDDTEDLMYLARKGGRVVMVGCQLRFHPNLVSIKQWVQNNLLGRIFSVHVDMGEYLPGWHPWENYRQSYSARKDMGGGVILTLIHDLDYLFWILGPVQRLYAMGGKLTTLDVDVEDTALISLLTMKGVPVQLRMDYWRNPPVRNMNIVGENGEINWDYYKGEAILSQNGKVIERNTLPENWDSNNLFVAIMKNFIESIKNNSTPRITLAEGIDVLKIALAAKKSIATNEVYNLQ